MIAASGRTRHGLFGVLAALLPSEAPPDDPSWPLRHRTVMVILGGHVAAVLAFAILVGLSGSNLLSDLVVVLVPAVVAALPRLSRPAWATFAAFGLMICCELLISDAGLAEDVDILLLLTVVIAALYRSWLPFLLTAGLVGLHNLMLLVSANAVGYQPGALADAQIHVGLRFLFLLGATLLGIASWRREEIGHRHCPPAASPSAPARATVRSVLAAQDRADLGLQARPLVDTLTGLPTRTSFLLTLGSVCGRSTSSASPTWAVAR